MAIHPLDMNTIYAQMDNVAKYSASQNQMAQSASQAANTQGANEMFQKSQEVQQVAADDSDTAAKVRPDGRNAEGQDGEPRKEKDGKDSPSEEDVPPRQWEIKDPRVGNLIDVAR